MMLHRHFESEQQNNVTKLSDVSGEKTEEFVSEIFPPDDEAPKRRGRPKKTNE